MSTHQDAFIHQHDGAPLSPQEAFRLRRALAEFTPAPDAHAAFSRFEHDHSHTDKSGRLWLAGVNLLAAACLAVLLVWGTRSNGDHAASAVRIAHRQEVSGTRVFAARKGLPTKVALIHNGDTLTPGSAAARQAGFAILPGQVIKVTRTDDDGDEATTLTVPQGKVAVVELSDGSRVWLGNNASLSFPRTFDTGSGRTVSLKGEAYFAVSHHNGWPFVVDCGTFATTVLGTRFNVRNIDGEEPEVVLVSGKVSVHNGKTSCLLGPDQGVVVKADGRMTVGQVDAEVTTSWKDGDFYFDGQTLRQIMTEVGRWYNIDVVFVSKRHISDRLHFNGDRSWSVQETVRQLRLITEADIQVRGRTLTVN